MTIPMFNDADLAAARFAGQTTTPWYPAIPAVIAAAPLAVPAIHAVPTFDFPAEYNADGSENPAAWGALNVFVGDIQAAVVSALAYRMTDNPAFGDVAARICRAWATTNTALTGHDAPLAACTAGAGLVMAASLLEGGRTYAGWTAADRSAMCAWCANVLGPNALLAYVTGHNWRSWEHHASAVWTTYVGDTVSRDNVVASLVAHIEHSIDPVTGRLPEEELRGNRATYYTYFSLLPILSACQILRAAGGADLFAGQKTLLTLALNRHLADLTPTLRAGQQPLTPMGYELFEAMGDEYQRTGGPYKDYSRPHRPNQLLGHHISAFTFATLTRVFVPLTLRPARRKAHRRVTDTRVLDIVATPLVAALAAK